MKTMRPFVKSVIKTILDSASVRGSPLGGAAS